MNARDVLRKERAALCDTFERLGPDTPTLCEDWTVADLAAHLVVRERDPRSGPGLIIEGAPARYTAKLTQRQKERGWEPTLARLRKGPPAFMLWTMPKVNVNENWVHHEDARRANGEGPRPEDPEIAGILLGVLRRAGRLGTRRVKPHGVEIELPDGSRHTLRKGEHTAVLRGPIGECALYLSGRRDAAQVEVTGDPDAVEALRTAKLGV